MLENVRERWVQGEDRDVAANAGPRASKVPVSPIPFEKGVAVPFRQKHFTKSTARLIGLSKERRRRPVGFVPRSERLHRLYNASTAAIMILFALPTMVMIGLSLLLTQGRPILYRGTRVGQDGYEFDIFKFRTLNTAKAVELTKDRVLPVNSGLETPLGGLLRDTRLDELPQLLNVLLGDMNLCGPRPVRPEIAELNRAMIRDYDARFRVKPGILGPAQAFMSHGTSKQVRARFNSSVCRTPVSYQSEFGMMFLVGLCVIARSVSMLSRKISRKLRITQTAASPHSLGDLAAKVGVDVVCRREDGTVLRVLRIDDEQILLAKDCVLGDAELVITLPNGAKRKARIRSEAVLSVLAGGVAVRYSAASDYSHHILERYLHQKVVVPHHSHFVFGSLYRALRNWNQMEWFRLAIPKSQEVQTDHLAQE